MTIISHPRDDKTDITLLEHSRTVAERMNTSSQDAWLANAVGMLHDVGKSHPGTQAYLNGDTNTSPNHSPFGAYVTFAVLSQSEIASEEESILAAYTVARHHGNLDTGNPVEFLYENYRNPELNAENNATRAADMAEEILSDGDASTVADTLISQSIPEDVNFDAVFSAIQNQTVGQNLENALTAFGLPRKDVLNADSYDRLLSLWGSLAFADITHAVSPDVSQEDMSYTRPTRTVLDNRVKTLMGKNPSSLDNKRKKARDDVLSRTRDTDWNRYDIGTIALPTGLGKTITGMSAALEILDDETAPDSTSYVETDSQNVIYALPFTSIIDQTVETFSGIFDDYESVMTTHDHLSDTTVSKSGWDEELSTLVAESWRSGMTITTFVQLFESLLGPSRKQATKIPQIEDSVIILDEPQALPNSWWSLIRRLARLVTKQTDATIISMTATPPYIFEEDNTLQTKSLVSDKEAYYSLDEIERVEYKFDGSVRSDTVTHREVADRVNQKIDEGVLTICNTIDSAHRLSEVLLNKPNTQDANMLLADWLDSKHKTQSFTEYADDNVDDPTIITLTSRHRPTDRQQLLSLANEKDSLSQPISIVSTQVVEAGVDISFKNVYRDLAPLPNIVQAAGRCNRENKKETGKVSVYQLQHPIEANRTNPSEAIYSRGTNLLNITTSALSAQNINYDEFIEQKTISHDSVTTYYDLLRKRSLGRPELARQVNDCSLSALCQLRLIDSTRNLSILVPRTKAEEETVSRLRTLYSTDKSAFTDEIQKSKTMMISVPVYSEADEGEILSIVEPLTPETEKFVATDESVLFSPTRGLRLPSDHV